jgi:hypothetical protein
MIDDQKVIASVIKEYQVKKQTGHIKIPFQHGKMGNVKMLIVKKKEELAQG